MRYQGGKVKASRYYAPMFNEFIRRHGFVNYVEPFCGSLAVAEKIKCENIICNDANDYLITLYKALQKGWQPPIHINRKDYYKIRSNQKSFDPELVAFAALCGFGGCWFGTYATGGERARLKILLKGRQGEDCSNEVFKSLIRLQLIIANWQFYNLSYDRVKTPSKSLIYCDPPYENTFGYKAVEGNFNSILFWNWVRSSIKPDNLFIVSEYQAPEDFVSIHSFRSNQINNGVEHGGLKKCDKLFIHKSQLNLIK
jgi:DNA adenine methylase